MTAGLAACSAPAAPPPTNPTTPASPASPTVTEPPAAGAPRSAEQEQAERLAAIQHAMNQLDEGAQLCWAAAAAVEGYQLAGEVALTIDIPAAATSGASAAPTVSVARDNTKAPRLLECMQRLLAEYTWAPPLRGQIIQLPFKFRAPDGQSVIDRRLVPARTQSNLSVAVLLDERTTGNAAASMLEVTLAAGATTELRTASRTEAWIFLGAATVTDGRGQKTQLGVHDMMLVPKGGLRQITAAAGATALRAVLVMTPGGEEGSARAGALPTPLPPAAAATRAKAPLAIIVRFADAARLGRPGGAVALALDPTRTKLPDVSAALLTLDAGSAVPEHQHATETELLYILEGAGVVTVGGTRLPVTATSVLQLPPGVPHAFSASATVRAIQLYTPAGPEQRFKTPPAQPSPTPAREP